MNALARIGGFADRVSRFLERVEYVRAATPTLHEEIFKLRYEANLREGTIVPDQGPSFSDEFDETPNAYNFAIYVDGELTSALRLHVLSSCCPRSPAQHAFPEVLDQLVAQGATIVDPNRLAADYSRARLFPQLPYATLRLSYLLAVHSAADYVTCTVRAEHQAFYKREYFARTVCPPREYPTIIKPIGLMLVDFWRDREAIIGRHGFYASTASERKALFGQLADLSPVSA